MSAAMCFPRWLWMATPEVPLEMSLAGEERLEIEKTNYDLEHCF